MSEVLTFAARAVDSAPPLGYRPAKIGPKTGDSGAARAGCDEGSPGPDLPPMDSHLRNTPPERLQQLFATVVIRGLLDKDDAWVNDDAFIQCCEYAGLQGATPLKVRDLYNSGQMNFRRLSLAMVGYNVDPARVEQDNVG